jgi:hypothetical protein
VDNQGPGHQPANERDEAWGQVRTVGFFVTALVTAESIPAFVGNLMGGGPMGLGEALDFVGFFLATFPVTSAVAIFGIALAAGLRAHPVVLLALAGLTIYATTWLGNYLALGSIGITPEQMWQQNPNPRTFVFSALQLYMLVYGVWTFTCCLIAGGFITWAWAKMQPHL